MRPTRGDEELPIIDPGGVDEYWVDGLASFEEKDGVVTVGFYADEPVLARAPALGPRPHAPRKRRVKFKLHCHAATCDEMQAQMLEIKSRLGPAH